MFFHLPKEQINYFVGKPNPCKKCKKEIKVIMSATFNTLIKKNNVEHYCRDCIAFGVKAFKRYADFKNGSWYGSFIIVPSVPFGCIMYDPSATKPGRKTNMDTTTAAFKPMGEEVVIDNTKYAGRESFDGAQVGLLPEEVDNKQNILSNNELDNFFLEHKESVLQIEERGTEE